VSSGAARVTAVGLLAEADRLLTGDVGGGERAVWPRACAILIRAALEAALDDYWAVELPSAASSPVRAQLLLLAQKAGRETAQQASEAWNGLSRAAHHHSYELAPTATELRSWGDLVAGVVLDLSNPSALV
jgi:hypothetical protein